MGALLAHYPPDAELIWSKPPTCVAAELEQEVGALDREANALAAVGELLLPGLVHRVGMAVGISAIEEVE